MTEPKRLLIDTSAWIEYFRPGGIPDISHRVETALSADRACVCELILLELHRGGGRGQRKVVEEMQETIPTASIDADVWDRAYRLADLTRSAGKPVPNTDLVIYACALRHGLGLVHCDRHFEVLAAL